MACWLVKNNVPFDVAFEMDEGLRFAFWVVFAEMEGNEWDWDSMSMKEK